MHGAPDIGSLLPAGTRACNANELRATSIEQALGDCNSTHGGWGLDNTCGDHIRALVINVALDKHFLYKLPPERNLHGDHEHAGAPAFPFWPHHTSILHQQMWWEWLKRAHDGGLRVMVALTVNNELLAEILNGNAPYDDKRVADRQIDEAVRFVNNPRSGGFMEIAYSSADVRRIVGDIEDGKAIEILTLQPTTEELEEAAIWATGNGDVLAKEGHPLSGKAAAIFDILTADEEEPPPVH